MAPELRDILFLDIETVACRASYAELDERLKVQWARKAAYLRRDPADTAEALFNSRAGIYAEFGKIVCIAVGRFTENETGECALRTKAFYHHDEKVLLSEFKQLSEKLDPQSTRFCAHNGKEFDFPYICRRMLVNSIALPPHLNLNGRKPWEIPHLDTMEMWKFGDYKHYTSLDLLAAIFDIPSSKSDIDGSQVNGVYYEQGDLVKIADYCVSDVVVLAQLYLRMKGHPLIEAKNIILA